MRRPSDLTREELVHIVEQVQSLLYLDTDPAGEAFWNPDKGWDSETLEFVAAVLADAGLVPRGGRGMRPLIMTLCGAELALAGAVARAVEHPLLMQP
jgi:hypothetical protein